MPLSDMLNSSGRTRCIRWRVVDPRVLVFVTCAAVSIDMLITTRRQGHNAPVYVRGYVNLQ